MASSLGDTSCVTHADRLSVARCPSCRQFYCSECITEHEGRMICAACLELKSVKPVRVEKVRSFPLAAILQCLVATAVILLVFYFFAQIMSIY